MTWLSWMKFHKHLTGLFFHKSLWIPVENRRWGDSNKNIKHDFVANVEHLSFSYPNTCLHLFSHVIYFPDFHENKSPAKIIAQKNYIGLFNLTMKERHCQKLWDKTAKMNRLRVLTWDYLCIFNKPVTSKFCIKLLQIWPAAQMVQWDYGSGNMHSPLHYWEPLEHFQKSQRFFSMHKVTR